LENTPSLSVGLAGRSSIFDIFSSSPVACLTSAFAKALGSFFSKASLISAFAVPLRPFKPLKNFGIAAVIRSPPIASNGAFTVSLNFFSIACL